MADDVTAAEVEAALREGAGELPRVGPALRRLHRRAGRRRPQVAGLRAALPRPGPDADRAGDRRRPRRRGGRWPPSGAGPSSADLRGPAAARRGVLAGHPAAGRPHAGAAGRAGGRGRPGQRGAAGRRGLGARRRAGQPGQGAPGGGLPGPVADRARGGGAHRPRLPARAAARRGRRARAARRGGRRPRGRGPPRPGPGPRPGPARRWRCPSPAAPPTGRSASCGGGGPAPRGRHRGARPGAVRARRPRGGAALLLEAGGRATRPRWPHCCARRRRCTAHRPRWSATSGTATELADRLGVDPGPALQAVHAELLAADRPVREGLRFEATSLVGRDEDIRALRADGPRGAGHLDPRPGRARQDPAGAPARPRGGAAGGALRRAGRRRRRPRTSSARSAPRSASATR